MDYANKIADISWDYFPEAVKRQAKICLKDLLAVGAGGSTLPNTKRIKSFVQRQYGGGKSCLWFQNHSASTLGAAFGNAFMVDSLDGHDGFRITKGHIGATVIPAVLAVCGQKDVSGKDLLTAVIIGYEIACRAGITIHKTYQPAYHSSGSWASLGAAAAAAKILDIQSDEIDNLLGITEYYSAMSPMMRCIDRPACVKDGAAAGAWAAISAIEMVKQGLTGPPSILTAEKAGQESIETFGEHWYILEQYFKPYPTCRWSHPAVEATMGLKEKYGFHFEDITRINVSTFENGSRLMFFPPKDSDQAQYSLPWAVAAALVDGAVGIAQVAPEKLNCPQIISIGKKVKCSVCPDIDRAFPEKCLSRVTICFKNGSSIESAVTQARGDYDNPLTKAQLDTKAQEFLTQSLGSSRALAIIDVIETIEQSSAQSLLSHLQ